MEMVRKIIGAVLTVKKVLWIDATPNYIILSPIQEQRQPGESI
jgi:hypothetical protein